MKLYKLIYSYQNPEDHNGLPTERERVLVTIEDGQDTEASIAYWSDIFGVFVIGYEIIPSHQGKPRFHLSTTEFCEYD